MGRADAFAAGDLLSSADASLAKEAQDGIALLLKDAVVRKEYEAAARRDAVVEMEQKVRKLRSANRKKEELAVVAVAYRMSRTAARTPGPARMRSCV